MDRDPSNGTALQEISFWLNLERALHRIQEKRESIEVALTLDILKHGKRFHATVSFDTDTGEYPPFSRILVAASPITRMLERYMNTVQQYS